MLRRSTLIVLAGMLIAPSGCRCNGEDSDSGPGTDSGTDSGIVAVCPPTANLDAFLPAVPAPTGELQAVFAGEIMAAADLIGGPASTGMIGDRYLRNDRIRVVIQQPSDYLAWSRYGGNIIDADVVRGMAEPDNDHFGKMSVFYRSGRTADYDTCEILQDGSGGGAAAIRCTGADARLDTLNLPGFFPLPLDPALYPHTEAPLDIAVTYILEPGADHVEVNWTFYNRSADELLQTNLGYLIDTGGEIEVFSPNDGYGALGFGDLLTGGVASRWYGYQAPGVAYGAVPYHYDAAGAIDSSFQNSQITISGVSVAIFAIDSLLKAFSAPASRLVLGTCEGWTQQLDFLVDASDVGAIATYAAATLGLDSGTVGGNVTVAGLPAEDVRVVTLLDRGTMGMLDAADVAMSSFQTDANGNYAGDLPAGDYLVITNRPGLPLDPTLVDGIVSLSITSGGMATADFALPEPAVIEYDITDATGSNSIPARILVVGEDSSPRDRRLRDFDEGSEAGSFWHLINQIRFSTTGSSAMDGAGITIEAGTYRVYVSRGTEWSVSETLVTLADGETTTIVASLTRVIDTTGYVAGDFHQHGLNSPDAPTTNEERILVYAAEGIEFIGASDHDFLTDYTPMITAMGVDTLMEASVGVELTTFDYGHFNAFPLTMDLTSPNNGAIDWANPDGEPNRTPDDFIMELRTRGADVVQVNHPRSGFQGYFDRAILTFDYTSGYVGDNPGGYLLGPDVLSLPPGEPLFTSAFDSVEIWNGYHIDDTNMDGVREDVNIDEIMRDWFRFTAFGLIYTGMGNSDSHKFNYKLGGYPRTYVAVPDDTAIGALESDVMATIAGTSATPRDVILTDGPYLLVTVGGGSAVGPVIDGTSGTVTLDIDITAPEWAEFNTVELFVNTHDEDGSLNPMDSSALIPTLCYTDRMGLAADDTCMLATGGAPQALGASMVPVGSETIHTAVLSVPLTVTGDTFVFVRVYGTTAIFPIIMAEIAESITAADVVAGTASFDGTGVPPMAIVGPILIDQDGNGSFDAPFAP